MQGFHEQPVWHSLVGCSTFLEGYRKLWLLATILVWSSIKCSRIQALYLCEIMLSLTEPFNFKVPAKNMILNNNEVRVGTNV